MMGCFYSTERVVLLSSIYKRNATQKRIMIGTIIAIVIMYFALEWHFWYFGLHWDVWSLTTIDIE